jgi:hypothetical protein
MARWRLFAVAASENRHQYAPHGRQKFKHSASSAAPSALAHELRWWLDGGSTTSSDTNDGESRQPRWRTIL